MTTHTSLTIFDIVMSRLQAFTFAVHGEYDMLLHVQRSMDKHRGKTAEGGTDAVKLAKAIMKSIDEYCVKEQWMYHVGNTKGLAIGRFLKSALNLFVENGAAKERKVRNLV